MSRFAGTERRMAPLDRVLGGVTVVILCCTALLLAVPTRILRVEDWIPPRPEGSSVPLRAIVVLHARDCPVSIDLLRLVQRPEFERAWQVEVLVVGTHAEVASSRRELRDRGIHGPVLRAHARAAPALRSLGHRATPVLVLVDGADAIRFSAAPPTAAGGYPRMLATLRALASDG